MRNSKRNHSWRGMNWASQAKRLGIYLRDRFTCQWCGRSFGKSDVKLTLDHVKPSIKGGTNRYSNLVTSCKRCNDSKRDLSAFKFAARLSEKIGSTPADILRKVRNAQRRSIGRHRRRALALIKKHGSCMKAVRALEIERRRMEWRLRRI